MQTNFFTQMASLKIESDIRMAIRLLETGKMVVTLQITRGKNDKLVPAMTLTEEPAALDAGFFPVLENPPAKPHGRFNNQESFIKQMDQFLKTALPAQTAKNTTPAKKSTAVATPATPVVDKKFTTQMAKVSAFEKDGKYRLAYGALPKETDFPTQATAIQQKKKALMALIDGGGLFSDSVDSTNEMTDASTQTVEAPDQLSMETSTDATADDGNETEPGEADEDEEVEDDDEMEDEEVEEDPE